MTRRPGAIRLVAAVLAVLGAALATAGPAAAHSVVTASTPADGARITSGPPAAEVTFDEALQDGFAALTVVGPDGNLWSRGNPRVHGSTIEVDLGELGPVGDYTVAYRVTSADGHVVSGTRSFTLTQVGPGTPGPRADGSASDGSGSGGPPLWPFMLAAGLVFAGALIVALRRPKRG